MLAAFAKANPHHPVSIGQTDASALKNDDMDFVWQAVDVGTPIEPS